MRVQPLFMLVWFVLIVLTVSKACLGSQNGGTQFTVETIQLDNQLDKNKTYFDLKAKPNQKQTLQVKIFNHSAEELRLGYKIAPATTNPNGFVEYSDKEVKKDESLQYDLSELLVLSEKVQSISIPKETEKILSFDLTYPKDWFEGIIAGGLTFYAEPSKTDGNQDSALISSRSAYLVAVILHGEKLKKTPDLLLKEVKTSQVNGHGVVNGHFQNPLGAFINQLKIEVQIFSKKDKKLLYKNEEKDMQMAPNSSFAYPLKLQEINLKPGDYLYQVKASNQKNEWLFKESFSVTKEDLQTPQMTLSQSVKEGLLFCLIAGIILSLMGVLKDSPLVDYVKKIKIKK